MNPPTVNLTLAGLDAQAVANNAETPGGEQWDDPLPLSWRTELPAFPVDALPPVVAEYVSGLATELQVPVDLPGVVALGMLSACSGGRASVQVRRGWVEPTNLWVVPVLRPGSLKSAVIQKGRKAIVEAEARLVEEDREKIISARAEKKIRLDHAEALQKAAAKDPTQENITAAQEAAIAAEDVVVPEWPRLLASDMTPESLVGALAAGGGRIAAVSAEAGIFGSLTGRYSKIPNLDPALQAHAGDAIRVDRRSREPEQVENPALTLIASIQPFALTEMTSRPDFAGRGLLARVLWSLPKDNIGYRDVDAPAMSPGVQEAYERLMTELAYTMAAAAPSVFELDPAAGKVFREYRKTVEHRLRPDGALGGNTAREWGSKLCGAVLRIAGALHIAGHTARDPVSEHTMRSATQLGDYFQEHAIAAFSAGDGDKGESADARGLLDFLIDKEVSDFKARDVQRKGPARLRKNPVLKPVLDYLIEYGWIRPAKDGGYKIHPRAAEFLRKGCDTCDTCDNQAVAAGQCACSHPGEMSQTDATPATEGRAQEPLVAGVASDCDSPAVRNGAPDQWKREAVADVAGVAGVAATKQPAAPLDRAAVSGLRQQARANLTRGRGEPQRDELDVDPNQDALVGDETAPCRDCGKPTAQWVLAPRGGRCITCAQRAGKAAS